MQRASVLAAVMLVTAVAPAWATVDPAPVAAPEADAAPEPDPDDDSTPALEAHGDAEPTPAPFRDPNFGPRYTIEHIVVRGNRKTASSLILGEIGLQPGDNLTASDGRVEAARIRLLSLGYFLDVRLALERGSERGGAVLVIDVEERNTVILNALYLGSSAATPFWGGLEIAENNLAGRGISVGGGFVASVRPQVAEAARDFGARLRALVPPLGGTGLMISATGIAVSGSEFFRVSGPDSSADPADFVGLRTQRLGGVVGLGRGLTRATRFFLDFREEGITATWPVERMRISGNGAGTPLDFGISQGFSRVGSLTATLDYDTRSDPLVPRAGTHLALSVEGAGDDLGSNYDFFKTVFQGSFYLPVQRGHIFGIHLFGGALFGNAPLFDRFFVGDMNLLLPPRAMGMNFSTQPSRNLLGTSIDEHRYDHFATRLLFEYAVPLWRRHRLIYSGDFFIAFGGFAMGSEGNFRDPNRSGLAAWPIDLTGDIGVRLDTTIGVFTASFANALGRVPF